MEKKGVSTVKILFFLYILSFAGGEVFRYQFGNGISITLNDVFLGILVGVWLLQISLHKFKPEGLLSPIGKSMGLFLIVCIASLIFNVSKLTFEQTLISSLYTVRLACMFALVFIAKDFSKDFKKFAIALLVFLGLFVVAAGYIQYAFYQNLKNLYYLGWDDHLYRMFSVFLDPNFAGAFFVLYALLLLGILVGSIEEKRKIRSVVYGVVFVASIGALYLTYSRSALVMFLASIFVFLWMAGKKKLFLFVLAGVGIVLLLTSRFYYIESINLFRVVSSESRIQSAQTAFSIFQDNPLFGIGFNAYRYAQIRHGIRREESALQSHADAGTDNSFLFVLATTGIVGFASYLYFWKRILYDLLRKQKNKDSLLGIVTFSSIIGVFVDSLFINSLFYPFIIVWVFVLVGLSENR